MVSTADHSLHSGHKDQVPVSSDLDKQIRRRIAHSGDAAVQTIAIHGDIAYLSLQLTFGGAPNPPTWCMFSEIVTDLEKEIIRCKEWDPKVTFNSAHQSTSETRRLDQGIPFGEGKRMAVEIPISEVKEEVSRVHGFIDDLIHVFVDSPANVRRQPQVVPLAMHVTSRPHAGENDEPIPQRAILSASKLEAEGAPSEYQIVLGWRIDIRRLTISLPKDKYREWMKDLKELRESGKGPFEKVESMIGRLNHFLYFSRDKTFPLKPTTNDPTQTTPKANRPSVRRSERGPRALGNNPYQDNRSSVTKPYLDSRTNKNLLVRRLSRGTGRIQYSRVSV